MEFDNYVDKTFIINLDHRTDRWEETVKELEKLGIKNYERFSACKIDQTYLNRDPRLQKMYQTILESRKKHKMDMEWTNKYILGSIGCCLSHYNVVKLAKERGYKKILILEDDARFKDLEVTKIPIKDLFKSSLDQLKSRQIDPDLFYLSCKNKKTPVQIDQNLERVVRAYWTSAYVLDHKIYDFILQNTFEYNHEIDVFYAYQVNPKFQCYSIVPKIIFQGPSYSDIAIQMVDYTHMV